MSSAELDDVLFIMRVQSRPGVLAKIAGTFHRRGLNIRTLTVGSACEADQAKIVARVLGPRAELERVGLAIDNLVDVVSVELNEATASQAHELCLVRVATAGEAARAATISAVRAFDPVVVESDEDSMVLRVVGPPSLIDDFLAACVSSSVMDVSRTGATTCHAM